jgi:PKD repeat protein
VLLSATASDVVQQWSYYVDGELVSNSNSVQLSLSPGPHQFYVGVTTVQGCVATDFFLFTVLENPVTVDAGSNILACEQQAQLSVSVNASSPYTVQWWPSYSLDDASSETPTVIENVYQEMFYVYVTDDVTGCVTYDSVQVTQHNPIFETISLCSSPATIDLGPGAQFYQWLSYTDTSGNNYALSYPPNQQSIAVTVPGQYFAYANFPNCGALTSSVTVEACSLTCVNAFNPLVNNSLCGAQYQFISTGSGTLTSWFWDFGDGTLSTASNPGHFFAPGTHVVTLTTVNSEGCTAVSSQTYTVNGLSITVSEDTVACQGSASMEVFPTGGSGNYIYEWSPSQGITSDPNLAQVYVEGVHQQGYSVLVYDVVSGCTAYDSVMVSSYVGYNETLQLCNDSVLIDLGPGAQWYNLQPLEWDQQQQSTWTDQPGQYIVYAVFPNCGAITSVFNVQACTGCWNLFSFTTSTVQCGTQYQFVSTSSAPGVSFSWDFGDGSTSNQAHPTHTYSAGTYTIVLTVTDATQCTSTSTQTITVGGLSVQINQDTIACSGQLMLFSSPSGGSGNYAYNWQPAAQMSGPTSQNPMMTVQVDQYAYVTVFDTQSQCWAFDSVMVYANQQINSTVELCSNGAFLEVDPGSMIYNWTFTPIGGGNAVSLQNQTNTLTAFNLGTYAVMTYYSGCQQVIHFFNVVACTGTCTSSISATLSYQNCGALVDFEPTYSPPVDSVYWNYGNGNTMVDYGTGIQPMFYAGGNYVVLATAYHSNGCISNTSYGITLLTDLTITINAADTVACAGQLVLNASVSGGSGQYSYYWPASGSTSSSAVVTITQNQWIYLLVTDTYTNCSVTDSIYVFANTAIDEVHYLCNNSVLLSVNPGSMVYNWSFTDMLGNTTQLQNPTNTWLATQPGTYVCLSYYSGCSVVTHVFHVEECAQPNDDVWPGDANSDNIVTNSDALYLGLAFNQAGPVRPAATINWIGQPCPAWTFNFAVNNVNLKHADCDGNGIINFNDTLAINFNYLNTHNKFENANAGGNPPIWVEATPDTVGLEQYIDIVVHVGTAAQPVDSLHGVAFSLTFNQSYLTENGFTIDFDNCVLGTAGTDVLAFQKNLFNDGMIDLAVSRTSLQNFQGYGPVAHARIVTTDNLSGIHELPIGISGVVALSNAETPVELTAIGDVVIIDPSKVGVQESEMSSLLIYPNPASDVLNLNGLEGEGTISVHNALGQVLITTSFAGTDRKQIGLAELNTGVYFIRIETPETVTIRKFRVVR